MQRLSWLPEWENELMRLAARGWTAASIASRIRLLGGPATRNAVIGKASRMGVDLTAPNTGQRLSINIKIFTPEQKARIEARIAAGDRPEVVGKELRVSGTTIRRHCRRHNIEIPRPPRRVPWNKGLKIPPRPQAKPLALPVTEGITLLELKATSCRFPVADGRYCGEACHERQSYCLPHYYFCHEAA